jgi:hypothetical protein
MKLVNIHKNTILKEKIAQCYKGYENTYVCINTIIFGHVTTHSEIEALPGSLMLRIML